MKCFMFCLCSLYSFLLFHIIVQLLESNYRELKCVFETIVVTNMEVVAQAE